MFNEVVGNARASESERETPPDTLDVPFDLAFLSCLTLNLTKPVRHEKEEQQQQKNNEYHKIQSFSLPLRRSLSLRDNGSFPLAPYPSASMRAIPRTQ